MLRFAKLVRCFRVSAMDNNPYINFTELPKEEKEKNTKLEVWDRKYDHQKYMVQEGPLKESTYQTLVDVEPFPRVKLMRLYYMTLEEIKGLPDTYCMMINSLQSD